VFRGAVLDAGCGTGDNALYVAAQGPRVLGIDVAQTAVSIARDRATARGLDVEFVVADALQLPRLDRLFDTVLDCALFHALDNDERREYVVGLAAVTRPSACLYLLCFSDVDPEAAGPHPVSRRDLTAPFTSTSGWSIASISGERLLARFAPDGVPAWLAKVERVDANP
jgi:SAM-dependent methyltransferase